MTNQPARDEVELLPAQKAEQAIRQAADRIANCYCADDDAFALERARLITDISEVVARDTLPTPARKHMDYCGLRDDHEGQCSAVVTRLLVPASNAALPTPVEDDRLKEIERWLSNYTAYHSNSTADLARAFSELRYLLTRLSQAEAEVQEWKFHSDEVTEFFKAAEKRVAELTARVESVRRETLDFAADECRGLQVGLGEWKELQRTWDGKDKREVWNQAVCDCAAEIEKAAATEGGFTNGNCVP